MHWHDRMELIHLHSGRLEVGYGTNIQLLNGNETTDCYKKLMSLANKNSFESIVQVYRLLHLLLKYALLEIGEGIKGGYVIEEALEYKVTPTNYIKINRLNKAINLLSTNNYSISEVSALCGFNEPNYFTRCFKSHFGKSPTEYMKIEKAEKIVCL